MSLLLNRISKHYGTHSLFEELTLQIGDKSRVGLIGRNGCGKSTLLKIIMGQIEPDTGSVVRAPGLNINYLSQEPRITPSLTLSEEMRSVFTDINALTDEENTLLSKLASPSYSEAEHLAFAQRLDVVHRTLERLDARSIDARIGRILKGLGFTLADHQRKTGEFSGGWQMRINLAKVLLEGADTLLLDEPTNHLDLEACEWLELFLREYPGGLIIVSHDRHFLDQVTTEIAELEQGKLKLWTGNYTQHIQQKEAELELITAAHDRQQKELARQTAFVERFRASATRSTQAKSREKQLAKIERIKIPKHDRRRMTFRFPPIQASGQQVLTLRKVAKSFGNNHLFEQVDADIQRGQRIFLLGANGTGKTTLLRLILELETLDHGEIRPGHHTRQGYFSQNQLDTLDPTLSIFDTLQAECPQLTNTELRTLLGCFLFTDEQVFKPVSVLSGGEKSKVALAKLMMSGANLLLLDEPTNHMDIPAKEVITDALLDYEGSMLCISHDRYFIQDVATEIWELYNGRLIPYCGDYEYYLSKRDELRSRFSPNAATAALVSELPAAIVTAPVAARPLKARKEVEKHFNKVEKQIIAAENEIATLEGELQKPEHQQDYQALQQLSAQLEAQQTLLSELNTQWTELAERISSPDS